MGVMMTLARMLPLALLLGACGEKVYLDPPDSGAPSDAAPRPDSGPGDVGQADVGGGDIGPADLGVRSASITVDRIGCGAAQGRVESTPVGLSCGPRCTADFPAGTRLTLAASSTGAYPFVGWTGACSGTGDCALSLDGARRVGARFSDLLWARQLGGVVEDRYGHILGLGLGPGDALYAVGYGSSSIPPFQPLILGGTLYGCQADFFGGFVAKLDARTGQAIWQHCVSTSNAQLYGSASSVAVLPSGDPVAIGPFQYQPNFTGDPPGGFDVGSGTLGCLREGDVPSDHGIGVYVVRYDATSADVVWTRHFCISSLEFQEIAADDDGDLYAGYNYQSEGSPIAVGGSTLAFAGPGNASLALAKYDGDDGSHRWSRFIGNTDPNVYGQLFMDRVAVHAGAVYVAGSLQGWANFGAGNISVSSNSSAFLAKYDASDGHLLWVAQAAPARADPTAYSTASGVAIGPDGDPVLTGHATGAIDFGLGPIVYPQPVSSYLVKYDAATGRPRWGVEVPCSEGHPPAVAVSASGEIAFANGNCDFEGTGGVVQNLAVARYSPDGLLLNRWAITTLYGNAAGETLAYAPGGELVVGAHLNGSIDYCGEGFSTEQGGDGMFLSRFRP